MIAKAKLNCYQLFHDNSYSMFNIIEFLDVITCQLNTEILLKTEKIVKKKRFFNFNSTLNLIEFICSQGIY